MKTIKTYEDFVNEEINLKKALATGALAAGMAFSNPAISQNTNIKSTEVSKTQDNLKKVENNLYEISTRSKNGLNGPYSSDPVKSIKFLVTDYIVDTMGLGKNNIETIFLDALEQAKSEISFSTSIINKKTFSYKSDKLGRIGNITSIKELLNGSAEDKEYATNLYNYYSKYYNEDDLLLIEFNFTCDGNEYAVSLYCNRYGKILKEYKGDGIHVTKVCCGSWQPFRLP